VASRVDQYLQLMDDPRGTALHPGDPADAALLALLAAVAFADGDVDDAELEYLEKVLPGRDPEALRGWVQQQGQRPLDVAALARALPTPDERWKGLRFAARMAWKDGRLADEERALLARIVQALALPESALERVIGDMYGRGASAVEPARALAALKAMQWDAVTWEEGPLKSPLIKVVPRGAMPIARIELDGTEALGLYREGVAGKFREGAAFLPWSEIVGYTRMATLGAAIQIHSEAGKAFTLGDFRLRGMATFLDRVFTTPTKPAVPPPPVAITERDHS
jgi:uncharacterized tellurite resistance protein B-like protein